MLTHPFSRKNMGGEEKGRTLEREKGRGRGMGGHKK